LLESSQVLTALSRKADQRSIEGLSLSENAAVVAEALFTSRSEELMMSQSSPLGNENLNRQTDVSLTHHSEHILGTISGKEVRPNERAAHLKLDGVSSLVVPVY
jgi:hypothetical protein